jgi:hypothetical protein
MVHLFEERSRVWSGNEARIDAHSHPAGYRRASRVGLKTVWQVNKQQTPKLITYLYDSKERYFIKCGECRPA